MQEIGAFEAKNRLGSLLDAAEHGEEITSSHRGRAVARLVPAQQGVDRDKARAAADHRPQPGCDAGRSFAQEARGRRPLVSLVLDSSVTLSWFFEEERTAATASVLEQVIEHGAIVPAIWRLEVANALQSGLRPGRIVTPH